MLFCSGLIGMQITANSLAQSGSDMTTNAVIYHHKPNNVCSVILSQAVNHLQLELQYLMSNHFKTVLKIEI